MFLTVPGLPEREVKTVMTAKNAMEKLLPAFDRLGISCLPSPISPSLPQKLRQHPDMNVAHLGGSVFVVYDDAVGTEVLRELGAKLCPAKVPISEDYPHDAALNIKICGDICFHRLDITDTYLAKLLHERYRCINVRQGYSGCSTMVIGKRAIITGDSGMLSAAKRVGMDALFVSDRKIILEGYDHGFIGGCGGMLAPDRVAFTGVPEDRDKIETFCIKHGVEPIFLTDGPCFDCGGIIPLTQ
ncbi:MAG: hypothetical protein IKM04_06700 [Clostridia bacterium]|nr:hypothetical protein [Clostridia bacterium]